MLKRKIASIALVICLLSGLATGAAALPVTESDSFIDYVQPMSAFNYISSINTEFDILSGNAIGAGLLVGIPGTTTKVVIYLDIQYYVNGSWQNYAMYSKTFNDYYGMLEKSVPALPGYTYRLKATYYAYSGSNYETLERYTSPVAY